MVNVTNIKLLKSLVLFFIFSSFILDSPNIFKDQSILDVGCGCGASSIAAKMVGASRVVANDTDKGIP